MNRRLLFSLFLPVLIAGCTAIPGGNPCAKSVPLTTSNRPIVCVDDRDLAHLTSSPYEAWARKNSPVKWYTVTGQGGLAINFADESCVKQNTVVCSGDGSDCHAQVKMDAEYQKRCTYSVTLTRNGKRTAEDPVIIVDDGMFDDGQKN